MAIRMQVEGFTGRFRTKNSPGRQLSVGTADVVRAAVTVGGPVKGTSWQKSLRRIAITGTVLAALGGRTRRQPLRTSTLYSRLEATEKGGISFRLGMAFASIAAERILQVNVLEHLNHSNSILCPSGSNRRADLFGLDGDGACHVIEAKARTHGHGDGLVQYAKEQAANVLVVDVNTGRYAPRTRCAAVTDLSARPISVLLADPPEESASDLYEIDIDEVLEAHYSIVPDLIALAGDEQDAPVDVEREVAGAYLPGTDIWIGVDRTLYGKSDIPWSERVRRHTDDRATPDWADGDRTSLGRDGHLLQFAGDLSRIYESWQERNDG